ncbi:hypothetical protein ENBRE01_2043 [Enteropsectra breve]|nr:hypothetical protein ENBRE01_2043 [Enteropsectra breve]
MIVNLAIVVQGILGFSINPDMQTSIAARVVETLHIKRKMTDYSEMKPIFKSYSAAPTPNYYSFIAGSDEIEKAFSGRGGKHADFLMCAKLIIESQLSAKGEMLGGQSLAKIIGAFKKAIEKKDGKRIVEFMEKYLHLFEEQKKAELGYICFLASFYNFYEDISKAYLGFMDIYYNDLSTTFDTTKLEEGLDRYRSHMIKYFGEPEEFLHRIEAYSFYKNVAAAIALFRGIEEKILGIFIAMRMLSSKREGIDNMYQEYYDTGK